MVGVVGVSTSSASSRSLAQSARNLNNNNNSNNSNNAHGGGDGGDGAGAGAGIPKRPGVGPRARAARSSADGRSSLSRALEDMMGRYRGGIWEG